MALNGLFWRAAGVGGVLLSYALYEYDLATARDMALFTSVAMLGAAVTWLQRQ